jgi:type VI secretion system protein ImpG
MIKNDIDILSEYYQYELSHLRSAGSEFASKFPKIARRLDLSNNESSDPHVERMIESFAFLTGKLQKQIDDQFPEIAYSLLDALYKPLVLPTPSCVMVNFDVDLLRASKAPGFSIPKDTPLHATSHSGEICSFRTSHEIKLWPMEITNVVLVQKEHIPSYYARSTYYLKVSLKYNGTSGSKTPDKLRFYILGDALLRGKIFSSLFMANENVLLQQNDGYEFIPPISEIGLEDNESLIPYPCGVFKGFRLLQEYFVFADKFLGFDIMIPESVNINGESTLYIPMEYDISMNISSKNLSLSSVPAINLFTKISEPLRLDYRQVEYCVIPDYRRYSSNEIYSIEKMVSVDAVNNDEIEIPEFFSSDYPVSDKKFYWKSRRKKSYMPETLGDDVYLSFIDMNFDPLLPPDNVFYAYTLCTNRYVAEQIPVNGALQIELSAPIKNVYCFDRPTNQKPSIKSGQILWKLISALSFNSISFTSEGIDKIRNVLNVFADVASSPLSGEVDSIFEVNCELKTKRINNGQTWYGFARGSCIEIVFDESIPNFGLPLSMIISKFLSSYTSINTFVEVCVKNTLKNGILKKWDQSFGIRNCL